MKREYVAPVVEKITFDYRIQTGTSSQNCFQSVMNVRADGISDYDTACVGGTPIAVGWTLPQTLT